MSYLISYLTITQLFCINVIYCFTDKPSEDNLCAKLCKNIPICVEKCISRQQSAQHMPYQLPTCGLSKFADKQTSSLEVRVKGGRKADLFEYPFMVSIYTVFETVLVNGYEILDHLCGGVILNKRFILTAAHCYHQLNDTYGNTHGFQIMLGSNSLAIEDPNSIIMRPELINGVETFITHPEFINNDPTFDYDIALIKTSRPIEMLIRNKRFVVNSICLPKQGVVHKGKAEVIGWGLTDPNNYDSYPMILQKLRVPLLRYLSCRQTWKFSIRHIIPEEIINDFLPKQPFLCAGNLTVGSAVGDSGGPLFREHNGRFEVLGMVSFGGGPRSPLNFPAGFTMVSKYMDWITETIEKYS